MASVSKVDLCMHPEVEFKLIREKSDGEGRPDLAENYLCLEVQLAFKKFKKSQCEDLLKATCALLNSGGGVLEMKISDYSQLEKGTFWPKLDKFWQTFENSLEPALKPLCYPDLIDRVVKEDVVFLFIKAADRLISIDRKLYVAGDARVHRASFTKTLELLEDTPECKIPLEKLPPLPETFVSGKMLDFHETKKIQFKSYNSKKTTLETLLHKKDDIKQQISAFANVLGGIILFGISNDGIVDGLKIDSDEKSFKEVEQGVESLIGEMKWCCTPQRSVHWNVKFFPVQGKKNFFVIAIYVAGMSGAVFAESPESYKEVQDTNGYFASEKWLQRMFGEHRLQLKMDERGIYVDEMSGAVYAESPESSKEVQNTTELLTFQEWKQRMTCGEHMLQLKMKRGVLKKKIEMSKIRFLPKGVLLSQKDSVRAIKEYFFKFSEGCPVYPEGFEAHLPEEAKLVVESIQQRHASSRACIVAAPSWYTQTKGREAYQEDIFCDLLLFDCQLGGLHLFTLFKSCSTARWGKEYGYNTAKALKNALVLYGGCYEWFYIGYHSVYCCNCCSEIGSVFHTDLRNQYPHQYTCKEEEANEEKLNRILESLVSFLGVVQSLHSNEQGVCFFNMLTMEQFGMFYGTDVDLNEPLMEGLPGIGRTFYGLRPYKKGVVLDTFPEIFDLYRSRPLKWLNSL